MSPVLHFALARRAGAAAFPLVGLEAVHGAVPKFIFVSAEFVVLVVSFASRVDYLGLEVAQVFRVLYVGLNLSTTCLDTCASTNPVADWRRCRCWT